MSRKKILELDDLAQRVAEVRAQEGLKVAHCHGVFDLLHIGHLRHFQEAASIADILVVTVTPDRFVNKGPGRPVFTELLRMEAIAALECVDYVALNQWPKAVETVGLLKPDFFVKGSEFKDLEDITGHIAEEKDAVEAAGGRLYLTEDIVFSSSHLINQHFPPVGEEASGYLESLRTTLDYDQLESYFERARELRVLVVGETIIDEYQYCQTLGKAGKEPILAALYRETETSAGGVAAAANHVAAFCEHVGLLSQTGSMDSHGDFILSSLAPEVTPRFIEIPDSPTIVKRRFVEQYPFQKLFEVYVMNDELPDGARRETLQALDEVLPEYDVVIVTDYGHGMIEDQEVDLLCRKAGFLAINSQKNAGNHGFNTVSKYPRADFVSVSESELRLDARRKRDPIESLVSRVAGQLQCRALTITQGGQGCLCYQAPDRCVHAPALTKDFKDRIGAGDALFVVASLFAYLGAPAEVIGLVGNAVGAQALGIVANRCAVDATALKKHLHHLLK